MEPQPVPKISVSRGALLSAATNSAFRWSPIGEVSESLSLNSRSIDEFYPELRVHLERPPETGDCAAGRTFDCVVSPQSRSTTGRNAFTANSGNKQDKVKVYVRMRPFSESEKVCPLKQVLCFIGETIVVRDLDQKLTGISKEPPHKAEAIEFKVDYMQDDSYLQVHSEIHKEESQKRMYGALGVPCIESALDGYNTTILAYGQTGSGKTYTMMGDSTQAGRGLIPRFANDLMTRIHEESSNGALYTVQVSYLEIYQEKIRDLLAEDDVEEEAKTACAPQSSLDSNGMSSSSDRVRSPGSNPEMKVRVSGHNLEEKVHVSSNNLEERRICSSTGSLSENSYASSFLHKAALQRQLEASQKHIKNKSEVEKSPREKPHSNSNSTHDGGGNKVKSPKTTKPAFDTVFNKQKVHKHYRTFPTVLEETPPVRKQHFLKIREHPITGPFVEGLLWKDVCNWYDMENLMKQGSTSRTTASTDMNELSSRSHAVFCIRLTKKLGPDLFGVHPSAVSYVNLVDLAGSEKLPKLCSGAITGQRTQEESRCINRSLSQLNEVILSLSKSSFVSYRNSVLTWLLKESLGGNSRTFMVANISPTEKDLRESINTLRYATTASRIPPPIALDQDPRNKLIKKLKEEICTLRTLLSSFTSVKENAPSDQLPSLQGFKVPCLDVGLQVADNCCQDDGSLWKFLHKPLDKGCQTENPFRDVGQQTTSRSGSVDAGFQIALKDGAALDMGNPTALLDSGRVDMGHQTLILNVCACDFGHQASPKDFGVLEVTVSPNNVLSDCGAKDLSLQCPLQGCGSVYLGHQTTLKDCQAVDIGNQISSRDWGYRDIGNQLPVQNRGDVDSSNRTVLRHGKGIDDMIPVTLQTHGDVDPTNEIASPDTENVDATKQITMQNYREADGGNRMISPNWGSAEAGDQLTARNLGPVENENQITFREWGTTDAGNQISLRNWGDVNADSQVSLRDWGPVDVGLQFSRRDLGALDIGNQTTIRDLGATDAAHQTIDTGNQITFREWGTTDAGNEISLRNCGDVNAESQVSLRDWGPVDVGLQFSRRDLGAVDVGNQTTIRDLGATDAAHQTIPADCGSKDTGQQTRLQNYGVNKATDCTVLQLDVSHQIDWREFGASDASLQVSPQKPAVTDLGNQVSWVDFGACDDGDQISWRDSGSSDVGHQVTADDPGDRRHQRNNSTYCRLVDDEHQVESRGLKLFHSGQQVSWTEVFDVILAQQVQMTDDYQGFVPDHHCHIDGSSTTRHHAHPNILDGSNLSSRMTLGHSNAVGSGYDTASRPLGHVDSGNQVDWNDDEAEERTRQTIHSESDAVYEIQSEDLCMTEAEPQIIITSDVGQQNVISKDWGEDVGQQNTEETKTKTDQQISLRPSTTQDHRSLMTSEESSASDVVNPNNGEWRNNGAVDPDTSTKLAAIDFSHQASLRVGRVEEIKEPFERRSLSSEHQRTPLERPGISVGQQASPRFVGAVSIGHQTSLRVEEGKDEESQTEWKSEDCCRPTDAELQSILKAPGALHAARPANCYGIGVDDPQLVQRDDTGVPVETGCQAEFEDCLSTVRHKSTSTGFESLKVNQHNSDKDTAVEEFGCQAEFEDYLSTVRHESTSTGFESLAINRHNSDKDTAVEEIGCQAAFEDYLSTLRHKSTSTDLGSIEIDPNGSPKRGAVEALARFQCGVCGATPQNSMVVVSTMVPIQEAAADVALQTNWIDFCATASELQTPTTGWGSPSDDYQTTPKGLDSVDEGSQVDWEELFPFHEQPWKRFGGNDIRRQIFRAAPKSLDLEELLERRRAAVHNREDVQVGPHIYWGEFKDYDARCENCEHDCALPNCKQHQARQEIVGRDCGIHNWQQHHHEIMLSEPSYLMTESDADTFTTDEETQSWNASWGSRHQNPQGRRDVDVSGLASLSDHVNLKAVRVRNAEGIAQRTDFRPLDIAVQARDFATQQVERQASEGITRRTDETADSVSTKTQTQTPKKGSGEEAIGGSPQMQTIQDERSGSGDFSHETHLQSYTFSIPAKHLESPGEYESGRRRSDAHSVCLSWLRDITGGKWKSGNVPAEEAFELCSLWTLAKLRSRMECSYIHSKRDCLKYRLSLATNCRGLVSQLPPFFKGEVATQTDSHPEHSTDHKTHLSSTLKQICLLWVFVVLRIAALENGSLPQKGKRLVGKRSPYVGAASPRKIRILTCLSDSTLDERRLISRRELYHRPQKLKELRCSGEEPLTFKSTTPFFIETSGDCSLVRTTRVDRSPPRSGNTAAAAAAAGGGPYYKILCGIPSHRVVHFLREGVNRLGSNRGAHIIVNGLSEDHSEFIYMPAHRCVQNKGYVVARLVAPGAMAFLNGLPLLEHKELCTGDVLVLRDLRYRSSVCTLHFFDLVKLS